MVFKKILLITITVFFLSTCSSVKGVKKNLGEAVMYGMVYNDENIPVSGSIVTVDGKQVTVTDTQGRFILISKQRKDFKLTLTKAGYEQVSADFKFEPFEVIHLTMVNAAQLMDRAEVAMDEARYDDVVSLCDRVSALDSERPDAPYLKALGLIRLRKYKEAKDILIVLQGRLGQRDYIQKLLEKLPQEEDKSDEG